MSPPESGRAHLGTIEEYVFALYSFPFSIFFSRSGLSNTDLNRDDESDDEPFVYNGRDAQPSGTESEEEEFVYNGRDAQPTGTESEEGEEEFVYPGAILANSSDEEHVAAPPQPHPSPAQLESLYAAASSGDLSLLKKLFRNALDAGDVEAFSLANDASTRTGFTALHAAASRGYLDIVTWCMSLDIYESMMRFLNLPSDRELWSYG